MKAKPRKGKVEIHNPAELQPLPILSDAGLADRELGYGVLVPVLIIDTSLRPDVHELFRVHSYSQMGDVTSRWASRTSDADTILLILTFTKPVQLVIILEFQTMSQGGLVDMILLTRSLYLQPGLTGDRLSTTMDRDRILIQVPDSDFDQAWDEISARHIYLEYRRQGMSRPHARRARDEFRKTWRKFIEIRLDGK